MNGKEYPTCKRITITQKMSNGLLGGPYAKTVSWREGITAHISQLGKRTIEIVSEEERSCLDLFDCYQTLEEIMMLFDGRFYPIESMTFSDSGCPEIDLSEYPKEILKNRVGCFSSKDYFQYPFLKLISFERVLKDEVIQKWELLREQMDIAYMSFLYSLSDNKSPIDMDFAFLVEIAEPLVELIKVEIGLFQTLPSGKNGPSLRTCIDALITHYGKPIFEKELNSDYAKFLEITVDSRIRIMHIKKNQEAFFEGKDCVRYSQKFSLLYRRIMLELLGVPYGEYEPSLKKAVAIIDAW